jgi:hypothetical protein
MPRAAPCLLLLLLSGMAARADDESTTEVEVSLSIDGEPLNPQGRFSDDLTGQPPRYYVWRDVEGWHLRTASQNNRLIRFTGSIALQGGTFSKLRTVGLERRGSAADTWTVSDDRTQVEFEILTTSSFDGFDFTVSEQDAYITFDLMMGKRKFPKRIFIGREGQHPAETEFTVPAAPATE